MTMADIDTTFASIRENWLDGIDIRYIQGSKPSIDMFKKLRELAQQKNYLIHGVFDLVNITVMRDFHIASLRVYKPLSQGPFQAGPVQPLQSIETSVQEYSTAVAGAQLASAGNHCIAFSLAAVRFDGAKSPGDNGQAVEKVEYCKVGGSACSITL
ncbi:hypothetical protein V5799_007380 [Amblyomma americanum]|uniref:Uncharacterized protein n=1 Tax=Amblyomma americanum TaxID=6943 RepID=A0AAQ4FHK0_AMBAM